MKPASAQESPSLDGEGEEEGRGVGWGVRWEKLGKGGGRGDEKEERGKQQAGMKVRKPSLVKEPSKN